MIGFIIRFWTYCYITFFERNSVFDCNLLISASVIGQVGSLAVCPCAAAVMSLLGDSRHLLHEYFNLSFLKGQVWSSCREDR